MNRRTDCDRKHCENRGGCNHGLRSSWRDARGNLVGDAILDMLAGGTGAFSFRDGIDFGGNDCASIGFDGGNLACNAGGPRAVKYGATRDNVLALTADGLSCGDISKRLQVSVHTIYVHNKRILKKLGVDADIALFRTRIQDFQEQNCTLTPIGALNCIPLNVPEVTTYGLEVDLRVRPLAGLTLNASGSAILGTQYPSGFVFDGANVGGQRLLYSPKGKLVLGIQYATAVFGEYEWSVGADATYRTRVRLCNTLAEQCGFNAHTIVGLRTGLRSPDDRWGVSLFVRNATDERVPNAILYPLPGKGAGSGYAYSLGANSFRSTGITADYRF